MVRNYETAVLDRALAPLTESLTPAVAESLLALRADDETQQLLDELGDKANEGTLTGAERELYEAHIRVGNLIAILQAKARVYLSGVAG